MLTGQNLPFLYVLIFLQLMIQPVGAQKSQQLVVPVSYPGDSGILYVNIHQGSIQVISQDIPNIAINASLREKEEIANLKVRQSGLQLESENLFDLSVHENNNEVSVSSKSREKVIDLEIEVPLNFSLQLKLHVGGNISAKNIKGTLQAENDYGNILIKKINNAVDIYSAHGNLDVTLVQKESSNLTIEAIQGKVFNNTHFQLNHKQASDRNIRKPAKNQSIILTNEFDKNGYPVRLKTDFGNIYLREDTL